MPYSYQILTSCQDRSQKLGHVIDLEVPLGFNSGTCANLRDRDVSWTLEYLMPGIDPRVGSNFTNVQVNDVKPAQRGQFMGASQPARPAVDPINIGPGLLQSLQSLTQTHQQPQQQVQPSSAYILVHEKCGYQLL